MAVASYSHCLGVCPAYLLAHLRTVWYFCLEPSSSHYGFAQENRMKGRFYFPAALCMQHSEKRAWQWGGEGRKHLSFSSGLT